MKLAVRAKALGKKLTLMTTAFVLAVSSLTALTPFVLAEKAGAVSGAAYSNVDVASGWVVDRTAPSGGWGSASFDGRQVLFTGVNAPSNAPSTFYQYEGIKKAVASNTQTLKADLYIDSSWPANVRTGFWGVGHDASGAISSYPIVEYNTAASATNWRIWDSTGAGGWRDVTVASATSGWNTIELVINKTNASQTNVYVNGALVGASATDPTTSLRSIILNNYNFGTEDYTVRWSNIQAGIYNPDAPTNLRFVKDSTSATLAAGSVVNDANITLRWDTVVNAERYQVRVTAPNGASQANRNTGWYTFDLNDATRYGEFGTQQGVWTYEVRTKDATTGLWSDYSAPVQLTFDSEGPAVATTVNGNALPDSGKIIAGGPTTFVANLTDQHSVPAGAYIELFKANYLGGYTGGWVTDNTKAAGSVRYGSAPSLVYDLAGLSGKYGLKIVASDKTGNSVTKYVYFTIDNSLPTATFVAPTPAENAYIKGTVDIAALVSDSNPLAYNLRVEGFGATAGTSVGLDYKNPFVSGATYTYSWNTATGAKKVNDGTYKLVAAVRDQADQTNSTTRVVTVDNTAPQNITATYTGGRKNVTAPTGVTGAVLGGALTFQINEDEANPANMYAEINWLNPDTNKWEKHAGWGATITSDSGSLSLPATAPAGTYQIKVSSIRDKAGNTASTKTFGFVVDNTAPELTVNAPANLVTYDNSLTVTGSVYDENISEYKYQILDENKQNTLGSIGWSRLGGTSNTTGDLFTADISNLANGTYCISVWATDKAGNATNTSGNRFEAPYIMKFTVDRAVNVSIDTIATNTATPTIQGQMTRNADGSSVANTDVVVTVDGTSYTTTTDVDGKWSVTPTVGAGAHTVTVALAGGASLASTSFTTVFAPVDVDEEEEEETANPAGANPLQTPAAATPLIVNPAGQAALGANDDADDNGTPAVEGTSTEKNLAAAVNNTDGSAFGLAWYWWLLIVAGLATILWWIIAAARRRQEEN